MRILSNLSVSGLLGLNSVADANTDTDKFLVLDSSGIVRYRTGSEVFSDIGAGGAAAYTSVLQHTVKAGVALTKGQAVYVTGADGTNMIVGKASNASEATSSKTLGLIVQNLAINDQGFVITEGLLAGLDTSTAIAGDPVWLGTDGNLIFGLLNKPYAPAHLVFIGIVTRVQQNNGEIFVKVQNGFELQELHNVQITSTPADNTVLAYENSTSLYKMKSIPTLLGYTPVTNARNITINGTTYDLSADRSWSVGTHTGNLTTGFVPKATGTTTLTDSLIYDNGSAIGINTTSPFESSQFKLDVNGGLIIKNTSGTLAQLIIINSNPATGGNNGFVQFTAGGNTATAFAELQTYYGLSIASGALRLQPSGGQVLIGTSTTSAFTTDINGTLRVSGQLTLGSTITNGTYTYTLPSATGTLALASSLSSYVPTSRTLTINGTSYDLSADRSWTIAAGVSSVQAGSGISVSTISGVVTVSNTGLLSATAGSGINVTTSGGALSISNTGLLSASAGSGISVSTSGGALSISNTGLLSASAGSGISVSTSGGALSISNTGILSILAGSGISVSTSSGTTTITNTITNTNQLTNGAGYITGITSGMVTTALGYTPVSTATTLTINGTSFDLSTSRSWTVGNVTGSGTNNYVAKFTATGSVIGNSLIRDDGTNVSVAAAPNANNKFYVVGNFGVNNGTFRLGNETTAGNEGIEFYKTLNTVFIYRRGDAFGGTYSASDVNLDLYNGTSYAVRISGAGNSYLNTLSVGTTTAPSLGNSVRMANGFQAYITSGGYPDRSYIIDTDGTGQLDFVSYPVSGNAYGNSIGIFKPPNISSKDLLLMSGDANIRFVTGGYTEVMRVNNNTTVSMYGGLFGTSAEFSSTVYAGNVVTVERSAASVPVTSGTSQSSGHRIRLTTTGAGTAAIDFGTAGATGGWIQATNKADLSLKYPLLFNPNGGNVAIGTTASAWALGNTLQIGGDLATINFSGTTAILGIVNAFYNGSSYVRQNTGAAASFEYGLARGNSFNWRMNGDGSAGTTASLPIVMSLSSNGNLSIGNQNDTYKLDVSGDIFINGSYSLKSSTNGNIFLKSITSEANSWIYQELSVDWGMFVVNNNTQLNALGGIFSGAGLATFITSSSATGVNLSSTTGGGGSYGSIAFVHGPGNAYFQGDVGIGTFNPSYKLDVNGTGRFSGPVTIKSGNGNQLILDNAGERFTQMYFFNNSAYKSAIWWDNNTNKFEFYTGVTALSIASTGAATFTAPSVGATYAYVFRGSGTFVYGSSTATRFSSFAYNAGDQPGVELGYDVTNNNGIIAGATQASGAGLDFLTFNGSSWGSRLLIAKTGAATFSSSVRAGGLLIGDDRLYMPGNQPISNWFSSSLTIGYSSSNSYGWVNGATNLVLGTDGNERMRIQSNGRVHIGAGVPSSTALFTVSGTAHFSGGASSGATFNIIPAAAGQDGVNLLASYWTGTGFPYLNFELGGNNAFRMNPNKEWNHFAEDNSVARANIYYQLATNEYRIYATNGSNTTTGVKLMEYNGTQYYQVLTTNTGLSLTGGTLSGGLTVNARIQNFVDIGPDDNVRTGLVAYDTRAMAAGVGGQLVLGYKYTSAGDYTEGAIIKMYKENAVSGQFGSGMKFQVRNTGDNLSTKMTLDPSGNLGLGVTPTTKLDVRGNMLIKGNATDGGILTITRRYSTGQQTINFNNNHPNTNLDWTGARIVSADAGSYNGYLDFQVSLGSNPNETAGTAAVVTVMRLTKDARVGIGILNPTSTLHIVGSTDIINATSTTTNARINIGHSSNGGYVGYSNIGSGDATNTFYVTTGSGVIGSGITMNNAGRVSIGTTAVDAGKQLYLTGAFRANITSDGGSATDRCTIYDTNGSQIDLVSYGAGGSPYNGSMGMFVSGGKDALIMAGNANIRFVTGGYTEIMRVTNGGEVFINTQSSILSGAKLQVSGTAAFGQVYAGNLSTGALYSNGGYLTNTNPSDFRLKNTIKPLTYGLNEILQLIPKTFYYNDDITKSRLKYGFIAQDVKEVMPELARKLEGSSDYLGLETEGIFVTLVNAVKELKAELDSIKNNQNSI